MPKLDSSSPKARCCGPNGALGLDGTGTVVPSRLPCHGWSLCVVSFGCDGGGAIGSSVPGSRYQIGCSPHAVQLVSISRTTRGSLSANCAIHEQPKDWSVPPALGLSRGI